MFNPIKMKRQGVNSNFLNDLALSVFAVFILLFFISCSNSDEMGELNMKVSNLHPSIGEPLTFEVENAPKNLKSIEWTFDDGKKSSDLKFKKTYNKEGSHWVALKIVKDDGEEVSFAASIKVDGVGLTKLMADFDESKVLVMSHRGFIGGVEYGIPENSMSAIQSCISNGNVNVVEIDPRVTRDGVVVLMHDENIDWMTTGKGKVSNLTYDEICQFDLKVNKTGKVWDEKVPTLRDVLLAGRNKIFFNLDVKGDMMAVYNVVKECGMIDQVFFYTGTNTTLGARLLKENEGLHIFPFYTRDQDINYLEGRGRKFFVQIDFAQMLNDDIPRMLKEKGFLVAVNYLPTSDAEVNSQMKYEKLSENGNVNMVQSDYSISLYKYLQTRNMNVKPN